MKQLTALGHPESKLWVIGAFPKTVDKSTIYTSQTGNFFLSTLQECGINPSEARFDMLTYRIPTSGGWGGLMKQCPVEVRENIQHLKAQIKKYKPNLVLCLGEPVLNELLGKRLIDKWRGHVIWSDEFQCKFLCTYPPSTAYRQRHVDKKQKPGQYETLMRGDLVKASIQKEFPETRFDEYTTIINPSFEHAMNVMQDMLDNGKILSYDIETMHPLKAHVMDCIGFATTKDMGICIPFFMPYPAPKLIPCYTPEQMKQLYFMVKQLLESNIPKVAQNSQYDTSTLRQYYDIHVKNVCYDTMIMAHNLYCDLPRGLGTLISIYTNIPYHKYMIESSHANDRWEYNGADAVANLHVLDGLLEEFEEVGGLDHYKNVINPCIACAVDMELTGTKINMPLVSLAYQVEEMRCETIQHIFDTLLPFSLETKGPHKINLNSPPQIKELFYDLLGCYKVYSHGKLTSDRDAIIKIRNRSMEPAVKLLANLCIKYSEAKYAKQSLQPEHIREGRMHCHYDVAGTDTGRFASKKSGILDCGTSLQNRKKGIQREMFIPDDEEEFCVTDLDAAEAYTTALDAGEFKMLEMLQRGEKIHNWMLDKVTNQFPEICASVGFEYKNAKQFVHGMNYNAQPEIMSQASKLPLHVCSWAHTLYHATFPGIRQRMVNIQNDIQATRSLVTCLGRKRIFLMPYGPELLNIAYAWQNQSTIGEVTNVGMYKLYYYTQLAKKGCKAVPYVRPTLNTHDGLVICIKKGTRKIVRDMVINAFNIPLTLHGLTIKIPVEIQWGQNFDKQEEETKEVYRYNK